MTVTQLSRMQSDRDKLLKIAISSTYVPEGSWILLWLYDSTFKRLRLDRGLPLKPFNDPQKLLENKSIQLGTNLVDAKLEQVLAPENLNFLKIAARRNQLGTESTPLILTTELATERQSKEIGVLQVLSPKPLSAGQRERLSVITTNLANTILSSRNLRKSQCILELSKQLDTAGNHQAWFRDCLLTLTKGTRASLGIICYYRYGDQFELITSTGELPSNINLKIHGPIGSIFENRTSARIDNFHNDDLRETQFGTTALNLELQHWIEAHLGEQQTSWMGIPMSHQSRSIGVIVLINKKGILHNKFSTTDQELAEDAASYISHSLPNTLNFSTTRRFNEIVASKAQHDSSEKLFQLFNALNEAIPIANFCKIEIRSHSDNAEIIAVDKGELTLPDNSTSIALNTFSRIKKSSEEQAFSYLYKTKETIEGNDTIIYLGFSSVSLADFEKTIACLFCHSIYQVLSIELDLQRRIDEIIQIRHAIRAGIGGLNHFPTAFRMYQKNRGSERISNRESSEIDRHFHLVNFFLRKTQTLLEESRIFYLESISNETLSPNLVDVRKLVRHNINCVSVLAEQRKITVINNIAHRSAEYCEISCDSKLLDMAIFNLLDNAIKYSYQGREVYISGYKRTNNFTLSVTNEGVPIREEFLASIFRPFTRAIHRRPDRGRPGTGLGLAVTKLIVNAHGGNIKATSEILDNSLEENSLCAKTTFTLTLPISQRLQHEKNFKDNNIPI